MKNNRLVVKINKPSSEVFAFYIDPKNTPLWVDSIVAEQTNEWPIKVGTVYKNQNKTGEWSEYTVTNLKVGQLFELVSRDRNYHVRYTHRDINLGTSELEYYEWVDEGEIKEPFTQDTSKKLKAVVEST